MAGLDQFGQDDFSAGSVLSVARHLIPKEGAYRILDGLLDDDGSIYRRGGSVYKSNAEFAGTLRFLWDHYFPQVGLRTLVGHPSGWGVLTPGDDATPIALAGTGVTEPKSAALAGDILWIGGGHLYGGSLKTAAYSTGTVTTAASATLTGSGTAWLANVDAGMLLDISGDASRYYVVKSVESDTSLTLCEPYLGTTGAGQTYAASAFKTAAAAAGGGRGLIAADLYAVVAGRLLAAVGNKLYMSNTVDPANGRSRGQIFTATDVHELPDGVQIAGLAAHRDRALIFSTAGVWMLSGLANPIVDPIGTPLHRLEQINHDLVLWGAPGIATSQNQLVAACTDGVYLLDGISAPVELSRSIRPLIEEYVRAGHKPGQMAVYKSHLLLPVLSSANAVVDVMVCRLDRAVRSRTGDLFPWTFLRGHGGTVTAFHPRAVSGSSRSPKLLAAGGPRVLDASSYFEPGSAVKNDADATTHTLVVETRDYPTGRGTNKNTVTRLRARYRLRDADADVPTLRAYYSTGADAGTEAKWGSVVWGSFAWGYAALEDFIALAGLAPADDGRSPFTWSGFAAKAQHVRFRLESVGAAAECRLRHLEFWVRASGRSR